MCGGMTDHHTHDCPQLASSPWSSPKPPIPEPETIVDATIKERGIVYGDPKHSHANIGLSWTGLLQQHYGLTFDHPIPASLVAQMMVTFKMQRSARVFKDDNYIDAKAYLKFGEEFQREEKP